MTQKKLNNALFKAIKRDDAQKVKELLDAGADVNEKDDDGKSPLNLCKNADIAKLLIDAGADVSAETVTLELSYEKYSIKQYIVYPYNSENSKDEIENIKEAFEHGDMKLLGEITSEFRFDNEDNEADIYEFGVPVYDEADINLRITRNGEILGEDSTNPEPLDIIESDDDNTIKDRKDYDYALVKTHIIKWYAESYQLPENELLSYDVYHNLCFLELPSYDVNYNLCFFELPSFYGKYKKNKMYEELFGVKAIQMGKIQIGSTILNDNGEYDYDDFGLEGYALLKYCKAEDQWEVVYILTDVKKKTLMKSDGDDIIKTVFSSDDEDYDEDYDDDEDVEEDECDDEDYDEDESDDEED